MNNHLNPTIFVEYLVLQTISCTQVLNPVYQNSYSDKQDLALEYMKWFARPDIQQKWWDLGGYSCHMDVLGSPDFVDSAVYAQGFLDSMGIVKDFWQELLPEIFNDAH